MKQAIPNEGHEAAVNHFELRLKQNRAPAVTDPHQPSPEQIWYYAEIWVDGQLLDEPHPVCVTSVLMAFAKPRPKAWNHAWHDVFTCGCGEAACANIHEGVGVVHDEGHVDWVFRRPQANNFGIDPIAHRKWCETAQWHQYRFDRHQATRELTRFLDEAWAVLKICDVTEHSRSAMLNWFDNDPRVPMRVRGTTWPTSQED